MSSVLIITDAEFATEVLDAKTPVLVYFWASWCGPCRLMSPVMDWAAEHYGDRLKVVKIEVDPNPDSVTRCQVEGVPALRLFNGGELTNSSEGVISKQVLEGQLAPYLGSQIK